MPTYAFLQDEKARLTIHSKQALGVASQTQVWPIYIKKKNCALETISVYFASQGTLEVMFERRVSADDNRGLGHGIVDNIPTEVPLMLLLEPRSPASLPPFAPPPGGALPTLLSHALSQQFNHPLYQFITDENVGTRESFGSWSAVRNSPVTALPEWLHVLHWQMLGTADGASALLLHTNGVQHLWDGKTSEYKFTTLDLTRWLQSYVFERAEAKTLTLMHDIFTVSNSSVGVSVLECLDLRPLAIDGFKTWLRRSVSAK